MAQTRLFIRALNRDELFPFDIGEEVVLFLREHCVLAGTVRAVHPDYIVLGDTRDAFGDAGAVRETEVFVFRRALMYAVTREVFDKARVEYGGT